MKKTQDFSWFDNRSRGDKFSKTQNMKTSVSRSHSKNRIKSARSQKGKSVKDKSPSISKTINTKNLKNVRKMPPAYKL